MASGRTVAATDLDEVAAILVARPAIDPFDIAFDTGNQTAELIAAPIGDRVLGVATPALPASD
ncbi:MAG TPA: hypothetical protein VE476_08710 [Propionibacteriaceae bacterium]|nr:hypothetical protein [Propionibacteriaceae bacterium]